MLQLSLHPFEAFSWILAFGCLISEQHLVNVYQVLLLIRRHVLSFINLIKLLQLRLRLRPHPPSILVLVLAQDFVFESLANRCKVNVLIVVPDQFFDYTSFIDYLCVFCSISFLLFVATDPGYANEKKEDD